MCLLESALHIHNRKCHIRGKKKSAIEKNFIGKGNYVCESPYYEIDLIKVLVGELG